jgi:uroporphyrinogen decarboxylase
MLEGGSPGEFKRTKAMLYDNPALLHTLLTKLGESVQLYLSAQIDAGVDCVMLFDTWGGVLSEPAYQAFSLFYMEKIIEGLSHRYPDLPTILFTKGGGAWLHLYQKSRASVIGLDWQTSISKAKTLLGNNYALQGNLDPAILRSTDAVVEREVARIVTDFNGTTGHIFNLGHGMTPDIDPEKVSVLVECVHRSLVVM